MAAGGRVGLFSLRSYQLVETVYGVWWAGGVINPINIRWSPCEIAYSSDNCDTGILFADDAFAPIAVQLRNLSGSAAISGKPTGVMRTRKNPDINALAAIQATPRRSGSISIHATSMFRIGEIGLTFQQILQLNCSDHSTGMQ